jgi:signal transduction histidine kinase/CheY-like chemotaxis protein
MFRWFGAPVLADPEQARRARLLHRLLIAMVLLTLIGAGSSFFDARNDTRITFLFYSVVFAWFGVVHAVIRTGRVVLAAWVVSLFFWGLVAVVTLVFGGMQGNSAAVFSVCTLLIGSIVGGRAALAMALASIAWCGVVAYLEVHDLLPPQLAPYTPGNAWGAVTVTVLLTTVLLQASLESLRRAHADAERTAAERDDALRRSIQGQKMELVGNLTSGIAHDLNNLLTVIIGTSEMLRYQLGSTRPDSLRLLEDLEGAASRASLMTSQLLSFGRVRSGDRELVDVGAITLDMGRMLPRLLGHAVSVEVNAQEGVWVQASRSGLEQILLNLAVNAREAMPDGGQFTLDLDSTDNEVVLHARDTGAGMSPEVRNRVFEPFFTTKATGTGLGLATVQKLVDHFEGSIELESESGKGTSFAIRIPRRSSTAPKVGHTSSSQESRSGSSPSLESGPNRDSHSTETPLLRVLLVEDDPFVRTALFRALEQGGYAVVTASDGEKALKALAEPGHWDCVVSDVAMPHLDGEQLGVHLAKTHPGLPMVLVSGNREPTAALGPGLPRMFLQKPVAGDVLRDAVQEVIAKARRR